MPIFRCDNDECPQFGGTELIPHVRFIWNEKTGKLEASKAACPNCNKQRTVVKEAGPIGVPWFKPENAKNYNNKTVKKYDYDPGINKSETIKIPSR